MISVLENSSKRCYQSYKMLIVLDEKKNFSDHYPVNCEVLMVLEYQNAKGLS